jgi:hypothetical protein
MFATSSKTLRSGTTEYPTPRSLIQHMVAELVASRRWSWVTFETTPMKHFVEVAHEDDDLLLLNVAYGFSEDYQSLLSQHSVTIPEGWRMSEFKKKGWLTAGTMLLVTSIRDQERIAEFVDRLFPALYGADASYVLTGVYQ